MDRQWGARGQRVCAVAWGVRGQCVGHLWIVRLEPAYSPCTIHVQSVYSPSTVRGVCMDSAAGYLRTASGQPLGSP